MTIKYKLILNDKNQFLYTEHTYYVDLTNKEITSEDKVMQLPSLPQEIIIANNIKRMNTCADTNSDKNIVANKEKTIHCYRKSK